MPVIRLTFHPKAPERSRPIERPVLHSANLVHAYFPGKGLPLSLCLHAVLLCALLFLRMPRITPLKIPQPPRNAVIERNEQRVVMYLPLMGGGSFGLIAPQSRTKKRVRPPAEAAVSKPKGLSYPGRQEIISDPPDPTNLIQTLQQPALQQAPILPPPLLLPNIVQLAEARTETPAEAPLPEAKTPPPIRPADPPSADPPPARPPQQIRPPDPPPVKAPEAPKPADPMPARPPEKPKPVEPPPAKAPEVPKPVEPPPAQPVQPKEPPPVRPPLVEPAVPPIDPMPLLIRADLPESIDIPRVLLPPLVPAASEKAREEAGVKESKAAELKKEPPSKPLAPAVSRPRDSARSANARQTSSPKPSANAALKTDRASATASKSEELPAKTASSNQGPDLQNVLALSPMPTSSDRAIRIPQGEARGRFAISPEPNLLAPATELGSKTGTSGVAQRDDAGEATHLRKKDAAGAVSPTVVNIGAQGSPKRKANAKPAENAGSAAVMGRNGKPNGGSLPGQGTGAGAGSGSGPGKRRPFSGITIVGGSYDPGTAADAAPVVQARKPLQTSYGVTVISTENSGGGLPYVGVFSGEQIYTVYLDMRRDEADATPSWTLEFAVVRDPDAAQSASDAAGRSREGLILPFPISKESPEFPAELIAKYRGRMLIVYGIVNVDGTLEQIAIKESPDELFHEPLLRVLRRWTFRPAQLQGEPTAVKMLMGIPLATRPTASR